MSVKGWAKSVLGDAFVYKTHFLMEKSMFKYSESVRLNR
jgi:hypothetical protein